MKIRTDFVTNSSSSSFMVYLTLHCEDGTRITLFGHEDSGDYDGAGIAVTANDAEGHAIVDESIDPLEYCMSELGMFDPEEIPYEVQEALDLGVGSVSMTKIAGASSLEALMNAITIPFGLNKPLSADESDDEDEDYGEELDENTAEMVNQLVGQYNNVVEAGKDVLAAHLTSTDDLKGVSVNMEFSGRGEFLADSGEILERVFGYRQKEEIMNAVKDKANDEAAAALRGLDFLELFTDESLVEILNFVKTCNCSPMMCVVSQYTNDDGTISMSIEWDEEEYF